MLSCKYDNMKKALASSLEEKKKKKAQEQKDMERVEKDLGLHSWMLLVVLINDFDFCCFIYEFFWTKYFLFS